MLVSYISPAEFLAWTVFFTHILVVITDGGSEHKSSDTDQYYYYYKQQVKIRSINIDHLMWPESVACCYRKLWHYFF